MLIVNYLLYVKEFKLAGNSLQDFPRLDSLSVDATIIVSKKLFNHWWTRCYQITISGSPMTGHLHETKIVFSLVNTGNSWRKSVGNSCQPILGFCFHCAVFSFFLRRWQSVTSNVQHSMTSIHYKAIKEKWQRDLSSPHFGDSNGVFFLNERNGVSNVKNNWRMPGCIIWENFIHLCQGNVSK